MQSALTVASTSESSLPAGPRPPARLARWRPALLLLCALGCGVLIGNNPFRPSTNNPDATARGYLRFKEVLSYVDRDYADSIDTEGLADFAVQRMLEKLDPHSVYIPAKDRDATDAFLQSDFDGIGVEFCLFRDTATVVAPLSGGPAEAAGLRPGDQIVRVGEVRVAGTGFSTARVSQLFRGVRGSSVALDVLRQHQSVRLNVTRNRIVNSSIEIAYLLDPQTGYIKVSRFAANTYDEFKSALGELHRQGMSRLVLDLRGNPGGYLDRATRLADEFIAGSRKIVYTDGKGEQYDSQIYARVAGDFEEGTLVVLVDEGSASAAEVLAGALQDHDRALLVGRRTFGKGLVQQPIQLSDGGELRLTIARYYTPSGRSIQKPYGADKAAYSNELAERGQRGEYEAPDTASFAKGLRFHTDHGRAVYGGGGIMPDLFVPRDSLRYSAYFGQLQSHGVLRAFALDFFEQHKAELQGLRFEQYQANFRISDADLVSLHAKAVAAGLASNAPALRRCAGLLRNQLKAFIARSAYGPVAYYTVLGGQDLDLQRALQAVNDSTTQLALLGK